MANNKIAVIGGGAAGFFAAIHAASIHSEVHLFEKSNKLLSKVKISGGGRCNLTHDCDYASQLIQYYPRGGRSLKKGFEIFGTKDTRSWFETRNVPLKVEADGRVFPKSDNSQSIIECLLQEAHKKVIHIHLKKGLEQIEVQNRGFRLGFRNSEENFDKVILACGGNPKKENYQWIKDLGLKVIDPIPSLFTFNCPDYKMKSLMGLSVANGSVQIPGSKWKESGPILITHWGFSGPGILKLSSWAARDLYDMDYNFPILINWTNNKEEELRIAFEEYKTAHPKKKISSNPLFGIPLRLWHYLALKSGLKEEQLYLDLSKKTMNKFLETLLRDKHQVKGKTTFKEEFVSCGGVELSEIKLQSFECKKIKDLFIVGELLNVDALTGGFNFQNAWTSGFLAGRAAKGG